ncbi:MAG: ROK family protein [Candidatus Aminicenantes bacterium]|nr:ROK family protein [Candidatus Aminicenantes bacterium]MDH5386705.1 ROK family protein [Candidatus Aminicenantes bacterium]MDH5744339.1 ROK family protein [Candidatus Aminicenantes bacterium]
MAGSVTKAKKKFCGAVDVGGTKIASALFTCDGLMLHKSKISIDKTEPKKSVFQIIDIVENLERCARIERGDVAAIGIAIPGVVFHDKGLVWAPNVPGWDHFPLRDKLMEDIKVPLVLDSDRSAYVLGEQWCGAAKNMKNVVFLAVGTGIGAGIIIDGRLCRGSDDIAGAIGWFALNAEFRDEYAVMGCFEAEASGSSVARRAIRLIKSGGTSILEDMVKGQLDEITAEMVVEAAQKEDCLAQKTLDITLKYLAMGIANIVNILNPDMVVLGGGLFQAGEMLIQPIKKEFRRWAQPLAAQKVQLELSRLGEDAGLYGAGKLAWDREGF